MAPHRLLTAGLLAGALAFAMACGGGSARPPTATPPEQDTPTPAGTLEAAPTEDPSLIQPIIDALRAGGAEAVRPYVGFKQIACSSTPAQGPGGPPACAPDERHGQQVDAFYYGTCEGQYLRPAEIEPALGVIAGTGLYAVYRLPPDKRSNGQYAAILIDRNELRAGMAWEAIIDDERIVALMFSCATTPEKLIELRGYTDAVLPPQTP